MPHHSGAELPGAQALRQMAAQSDSRGLFSDRAPDPAYAGLFLNRELSWLQFNRRVLAEAADETLPGYERLKFLSIYCSNLDEFYMVRVGGLLDRALLQPWHTETITGLTPREQLRAIYDETARQQKDFEALWRKVTAALAKQHVEMFDGIDNPLRQISRIAHNPLCVSRTRCQQARHPHGYFFYLFHTFTCLIDGYSVYIPRRATSVCGLSPCRRSASPPAPFR